MKRRRRILRVLLAIVLVAGVGLLIVRWRKYNPAIGSYSMAECEQEFLNGTYRNEEQQGIPSYVAEALPEMFPELFRADSEAEFRFVRAPGRDLPIGLVKTQYDGIEWITHNCSLCHVAGIRSSQQTATVILPGAPAGYWREKYLKALETAFLDPSFTPERVITVIQKRHTLSPQEEQKYRKWISWLTSRTLTHVRHLDGKRTNAPADGPGRMDSLLLGKERAFQVDSDIGTTDYAPLWNRSGRFDARGRIVGHWDGFGQNLLGMVSASLLADGVQPKDFSINQAKKLAYYFLHLSSPSYPFAINQSLAAVGKPIFETRCAECHGPTGARLNSVIPLEEIQTDPNRSRAARPLLLWTLNIYDFFQRYPAPRWRKTNGYRAELLDGLWVRAPYLHNGSVPNLSELLETADRRSRVFYRGSDVYDRLGVGFVGEGTQAGIEGFRFDTSAAGNSNEGHTYGTDLSSEDKQALIEYLKTL